MEQNSVTQQGLMKGHILNHKLHLQRCEPDASRPERISILQRKRNGKLELGMYIQFMKGSSGWSNQDHPL